MIFSRKLRGGPPNPCRPHTNLQRQQDFGTRYATNAAGKETPRQIADTRNLIQYAPLSFVTLSCVVCVPSFSILRAQEAQAETPSLSLRGRRGTLALARSVAGIACMRGGGTRDQFMDQFIRSSGRKLCVHAPCA